MLPYKCITQLLYSWRASAILMEDEGLDVALFLSHGGHLKGIHLKTAALCTNAVRRLFVISWSEIQRFVTESSMSA